DGCGGTCGGCPPDQYCQPDCGDTCSPEACPDGPSCDVTYACVTDTGCVPQCVGKTCGADGCGGYCGLCPDGVACDAATFSCPELPDCYPLCDGKACGDDGCGGVCGICPGGGNCGSDGQCLGCDPGCGEHNCGPDACGGVCGVCAEGIACEAGICCVPACDGRLCGDDGCGGVCGECADSQACVAGTCVGGVDVGDPPDTGGTIGDGADPPPDETGGGSGGCAGAPTSASPLWLALWALLSVVWMRRRGYRLTPR
ncbi:MAG: hypothetical protein QF464_18660, partial [Myxococcota bacterium]|nr:hypothetical protein [Myxococcota bacterium]